MFPSIIKNGSGTTKDSLHAFKSNNLTVTSGTFDLGTGFLDTLTGNVSGTGGTINFNTSTIVTLGSTVNLGSVGISAGTGTLCFAAPSGVQVFSPHAGQTHPSITHPGADTLRLSTAALIAKGFSNSAGILDLNGSDITVVNAGSFAISNGTSSTLVNLGGRTIAVAGAASFFGQSGNPLNLNPGSDWTISDSGNLIAKYATIARSHAIKDTGMATNSADSGGNTGWLFPSGKVWVGKGTNKKWSNIANWADNVLPSSSDTVYFNATSAVSCSLDVQDTVKGIIFNAGYTGTFCFDFDTLTILDIADFRSGGPIIGTGGVRFTGATAQTFYPKSGVAFPTIMQRGSGTTIISGALTASNISINSGILKLGKGFVDSISTISGTGGIDFDSSTLQIGGATANFGSFTSITPGSGTLSFTGSAAQTFTPAANKTFPAILQNGSGTTTVTTNNLAAGILTIAKGIFNLGGRADTVLSITSVAPNSGNLTFSSSTLQVRGGDADLTNINVTANTGTISFMQANAIQKFIPHSGVLHPNITVNGVGDTVVVTNRGFKGGALTIAAGLFNLGGFPDTVTNINPSAGGLDFNSDTLVTSGTTVNLGSLSSLTNTGALVFNAALGLTQAFTPKLNTTHPAIIHSGTGTLTLQTNDLNTNSFSQSAGVLNFNSRNITTKNNGNFTITNGASTTFSGLGNNRIITVDGNASFNGTSATNLLNMNPISSWALNVKGGLTAQLATIGYCKATSARGYANNSYNNGNDSNWIFLAGKVWTDSSGDNKWSTAGNWSGGAVPSSSDTATFSNMNTGDCNLDINDTVKSLVCMSGYTGTIHFGSDTLIASGDLDFRQCGGIDAGTGAIVLNGATHQTFQPKTGQTFPAIVENGGGTDTIAGANLSTSAINIASGNLVLGNGLTHTIGTISGSGSIDLGSSILQITGASVNFSGFTSVVPGTGKLFFLGASPQTFAPKSGVTFSSLTQNGTGGTILSNSLQADSIRIASGDLNFGTGFSHIANVLVDGAPYTGRLLFNSSGLRINGTLMDSVNVIPGSGSLQFGASGGTQVFVPHPGAVYPAISLSGSPTTTLRLSTNALSTKGYSQTAGILDLNGVNVSTVNGGNFSIANGTSSSLLNLDNRTITVAGNATLDGQAGSLIDLNPASPCTLAVSGSLIAHYAQIAKNTASQSQGIAIHSTDGGSNHGWNFTAGKVWTNASGDSKWSTLANWSDNVLPVATDTVTFSNLYTGNCNLDISASVKALAVAPGYTGTFSFQNDTLTVTQDVDFRSVGAISAGTGAIVLSGSGSQALKPKTGEIFPAILKTGSGFDTISGGNLTTCALNVSAGMLCLGNGLTHAVGTVSGVGGSIDFGSSTLQVTGASADFSGMSTVAPGTGKLIFTGTSAQTFTPKLGVTLAVVKQCGTGGTTVLTSGMNADSLQIASGVFNLGIGLSHTVNTITSSAPNTGSVNFKASTLRVNGATADFTAINVVDSTGILHFGGSGVTQAFTPKLGGVFPAILLSGSSTLQLYNNALTAKSYTQNAGSIDLHGENISTVSSGNFTVNNGSSSSFINLDGRKITVAGNAVLNGQSSGLLGLNPASPCTLAVSGTLTAQFARIANNTASNSAGLAISSINDGGNSNWNFPAGAVWSGNGNDNKWSTAANWTTNAIPGASDTVSFTNLSAANCNLDVSATVKTITFNGYTGVFGFTNDTLTVSGDADLRSAGTITAGTGTLLFNGSSLQVFKPKSGTVHPTISHSGAGTLQLSTYNLTANGFNQTSGSLDLHNQNISIVNNGNFVITNGSSSSFVNLDNRTITVAGNATLSGQSGSLLNINPAAPCTLAVTGRLTAQYARIANSTASVSAGLAMSSVDSGGNHGWSFLSGKVWSGGAGDHRWSTAANWSTNTVPFAGDTVSFTSLNTSDCSMDVAPSVKCISFDAGYTGRFDFTTNKLTITGNGDFRSGGSLTAGTGALEFAGSGTEVFIPQSGATFPAVSMIGSGTLQLSTNNLSANGFALSSGTLDFNGQNITTSNGGNFTIRNGTPTTFTNIGGRTITVSGLASFDGQQRNLLNLNPTSPWTINVTGSLTATYSTIANSNASGSTGSATFSVNGGGNSNWGFVYQSDTLYVKSSNLMRSSVIGELEKGVGAMEVIIRNPFTKTQAVTQLNFTMTPSNPSSVIARKNLRLKGASSDLVNSSTIETSNPLTFDLSSTPVNIAPGQSDSLDVYFDVNGSPAGSIKFAIASGSDISAIDSTSGLPSTVLGDGVAFPCSSSTGTIVNSTATPSGKIIDGSMADWTAAAEQIDACNTSDKFYVTWDSTHLYLAWSGRDLSNNGDLFIYMNTGKTGGAKKTLNYKTNGIHYFPSAFTSNYLYYFDNAATNGLLADSTFTPATFTGSAAASGSNTEICIPFADIGNPDSIKILPIVQNENSSQIAASVPHDNVGEFVRNPIGSAPQYFVSWLTIKRSTMTRSIPKGTVREDSASVAKPTWTYDLSTLLGAGVYATDMIYTNQSVYVAVDGTWHGLVCLSNASGKAGTLKWSYATGLAPYQVTTTYNSTKKTYIVMFCQGNNLWAGYDSTTFFRPFSWAPFSLGAQGGKITRGLDGGTYPFYLYIGTGDGMVHKESVNDASISELSGWPIAGVNPNIGVQIISAADRIYVACTDGSIKQYDVNGNSVASYATGSAINQKISYNSGAHHVYCTPDNGNLIAVNSSLSSDSTWSLNIGTPIQAGALYYSTGSPIMLYCPTGSNMVEVEDDTSAHPGVGRQIWNSAMQSSITVDPASQASALYFSTSDNRDFAIYRSTGGLVPGWPTTELSGSCSKIITDQLSSSVIFSGGSKIYRFTLQ